jgi:hypothetical protein
MNLLVSVVKVGDEGSGSFAEFSGVRTVTRQDLEEAFKGGEIPNCLAGLVMTNNETIISFRSSVKPVKLNKEGCIVSGRWRKDMINYSIVGGAGEIGFKSGDHYFSLFAR